MKNNGKPQIPPSMVSHNFQGAFGQEREMVELCVPGGVAGYHRWCCVELGVALGGSKEEPNLDRSHIKERQGGREAVA